MKLIQRRYQKIKQHQTKSEKITAKKEKGLRIDLVLKMKIDPMKWILWQATVIAVKEKGNQF